MSFTDTIRRFEGTIGMLTLLAAPLAAAAQKTGGGGGSPNSTSPSPSPSQPSGNNNSAGGGGQSIESTLFGYRALAAESRVIAAEIAHICGDTACSNTVFVVTTPGDVTNLVAWRAIMAQANLLRDRARNRPKVVAPGYLSERVQARVGEMPINSFAFITGPSDVQTLVQTAQSLAGMFAVNESYSPAVGAMTDAPLINMVARDLNDFHAQVFVPSTYPSNLFGSVDLSGTFLYSAIHTLEELRTNMGDEAQRYLGWLDSSRTIAKSSDFSDADRRAARAFLTDSTSTKAVIATLNSLIAAIDVFEGSLFSGQTPAPSNSQGQQPSSPASSPSGSPGGGGPANSGNNSSPSPTSTAGGAILQQILSADLLVKRILPQENPDAASLAKIHILALHALESGGGVLTKTGLFSGSKVSFTGGAVATFALFDAAGRVQCAGFASAYRGAVRQDHVEDSLSDSTRFRVYSDGPSFCH